MGQLGSKSTRGASGLAYGLLLGMIAVVVLTSIQSVGIQVNALFSLISGEMGSALSGERAPRPPPTPSAEPSEEPEVFDTCTDVLADNPNAPSGTYTAEDGTDFECEMDVGGGGWTRIWRAPSANLNTDQFDYDYPAGAVGAVEFMIAFTDASDPDQTELEVFFDTPSGSVDWTSRHPLGVRLSTVAGVTATFARSGATVSGLNLFAGTETWGGSGCHGGWIDADDGVNWGRICLGTSDGYGLAGSPFYNGFFLSSPDDCVDGAQGFDDQNCSDNGRRFTIYARQQARSVPLSPHHSCQDVLDDTPSAANGTYTLNIDGTNEQVFCDLTTEGVGWTEVWRASSPSLFTSSFAYDLPSVAADATEFMVAYVNPATGALTAQTIATQPGWATDHPLSFASGAADVPIRLAGGSNTIRRVVHGRNSWGSNSCPSSLGGGTYGLLCFPSLSGAVFYSGFSGGYGNYCSTSEQNYASTLCSNARLVTILVR